MDHTAFAAGIGDSYGGRKETVEYSITKRHGVNIEVMLVKRDGEQTSGNKPPHFQGSPQPHPLEFKLYLRHGLTATQTSKTGVPIIPTVL